MDTQLHKQQMYNVIGAAMAVYNEIGYGFSELVGEHRAQLFNYMKITNTHFGILINFGEPQRLHAEKYMYNELTNKFDIIRG